MCAYSASLHDADIRSQVGWDGGGIPVKIDCLEGKPENLGDVSDGCLPIVPHLARSDAQRNMTVVSIRGEVYRMHPDPDYDASDALEYGCAAFACCYGAFNRHCSTAL